MGYDPHKHHRRSVRLKGYDYRQKGAYFITICSKNGACVFGDIVEGKMVLNEWGQVLLEEWEETAVLRPTIELGIYQIMPNHIHLLFWLLVSEHIATEAAQPRQFAQPQKGAVGTIVGLSSPQLLVLRTLSLGQVIM